MSSDSKKIPMWAKTGHQRPVTRRELLASGVIPFAASMIVPNWLSLLIPENANAANCAASSSDLMPFVSLNLSGGAGLCGNYVALDKAGQLLPSYNVMGLGKTPPVVTEFGNVPFAGMNGGALISKFLQGIRERAPTAIGKTAFVATCVRSRDDSGENKFSVDGLLAQAGLAGSLYQNLGRNANKMSGVNNEPAVVSPPAPLVVDNFSALTSSLGYAGAIGTSLKDSQKQTLASFISRLSQTQTRKVASITTGDQLKNLLDCAGIKNEELIGKGSDGVDPRKDSGQAAVLNNIWGINNGTAANSSQLIFGSMAYNAIKGNAGSVALEIGGYDYHDGSRTTGDAKDLEAGRAVGNILETAATMNRPVFIYVTSDGATSSTMSDSPNSAWSSDRGTAGLSFMLYFNPAGRPETSGFQIGYFNEGQTADEQFVTGNSPEAAAISVFANYLAANKRLDLFQKIVGRSFNITDLEKVLKFS